MPAKKKPRKPMSEEARAAASERMRRLNEAKRATPAPQSVPAMVAEADEQREVETIEAVGKALYDDPVEPEHKCQWLPGDYKAHDGNGWRLEQVYCPVGKHWEAVSA